MDHGRARRVDAALKRPGSAKRRGLGSVFLAVLAIALPPLGGGCAATEPTPAPTPSAARSTAPTATGTAADAIELFDGKTLAGWTRRGGEAEYRVEDGAIVGRTRPGQRNSFLCTDRLFADFELTFEFQIDDEANSGVQFRSRSVPEYRKGQVYGYQFEIDPSARAWTGGIYEEGRRGWLANLAGDAAARAAFRPRAWNRGRVRAEGARIRTWLNDVPAADLCEDLVPDAIREGFIALQVHGVGERAEPLVVRWRSLRLIPLR